MKWLPIDDTALNGDTYLVWSADDRGAYMASYYKRIMSKTPKWYLEEYDREEHDGAINGVTHYCVVTKP